MDVGEYVEALRREGQLLIGAARAAPLDRRVPSCPEWDVRELVRHVGGVHTWAIQQVDGRRTDEISGDLVDIVGGWPRDENLVDWAADQHARLVEVFEDADPEYPYFTWFRGDTPLTMWTRRQAHETAIHRVDAELAAGRSTPFPSEFAADGVSELVLDMVGDWKRGLSVARDVTLHLRSTDVGRSWAVVMAPDGFTMSDRAPDRADCEVVGSADALYRLVWHRGGIDDVTVTGDHDVLAAWWASVQPRWS